MSRAKKVEAVRPKKPPPTTCMDDPFAVTTSGSVLLNIQNFDDVETAEDALRRALQERTPIFIGVTMSAREVRSALAHLGDIWHEASWFLIGARQRRARRRRS